MAIAPPSDIILDVAQAADPSRLQAATLKLARMAGRSGGASDSFDIHVKDAVQSRVSAGALAGTTRFPDAPVVHTRPGSPYQKFEAMVLQSFVENILPKDENLFGDAASADVCRSMLAEQLATQLAKGGSLGIAKMIQAAHPPDPAATAAARPNPAPPLPPGPGAGAGLDPLGAELVPRPHPSAAEDAS